MTEVFGIDGIEGFEVVLHIRQKHLHVYDVFPRRATVFENEPNVAKHAQRLHGDIVGTDGSIVVAFNAGDGRLAALTRTYPAQEQQVANAPRMGIGPNGFCCSVRIEYRHSLLP